MLDQLKKAEQVSALAKKLGFQSCLLVMRPDPPSTQLFVVLEADDPKTFVALIAEPIASVFDAVAKGDNEA